MEYVLPYADGSHEFVIVRTRHKSSVPNFLGRVGLNPADFDIDCATELRTGEGVLYDSRTNGSQPESGLCAELQKARHLHGVSDDIVI